MASNLREFKVRNGWAADLGISLSGAAATTTLYSNVTTGSIALGAGLTTGALNIATVGTGATPIGIGHTNAIVTFTGTINLPTSTTKVGNTSLLQGGSVNITFPTLAGTLIGTGDSGSIVTAMYAGSSSTATGVTYAKQQYISAQYRMIGRITAAAGVHEELTPDNVVTVLGQATTKQGTGSVVLASSPTLTTPVIDTIAASAASATPVLWSTVTTGSIGIGAGLTTGALNIAASGTGVTPITIGHTNATLAVTSSGFNLTTGGQLTLTSSLIAPAATTSIPSIRLPHGTAPSSPTNGDMWSTTAGFYGRVNGSTVGPFSTGGGGGDVYLANANVFTNALNTFQSASSYSPQVIIKNTNNDGSAGYVLFAKETADHALTLGDYMGTFLFQAPQANSPYTLFNAASFAGQVMSQGTTFVEGHIVFATTDSAGTTANRMRITDRGIELDGHDLVSTYVNDGPESAPGVALRRAQIGTTAVDADDTLGYIGYVEGYDGTDFIPSAQILALADGTPSASIVPGRIEFHTADLTGAMTKKMEIGSTGDFYLNDYRILHQSDTAPSSPYEGQMWRDTVTGAVYSWYDSFWVEIGSAGGQLIAPVTITGTAAASTPLTVKGAASQSVDYFQIQTSASADVVAVDSTGALVMSSGPIKPMTGTTALAPIVFASGSLLSSHTLGALEFGPEAFYITSNASTGRAMNLARQSVLASGNSSAATTTTAVSPFGTSNDTINVEANKIYYFKGKYFLTSTFTSGTANIRLGFTFSQAAASIKYNFKTYNQTAGTTIAREGTVTSTASTQISANVTATISLVCEFEGYFTSHASNAGTVLPYFDMSTTGSSTVATQYSVFELQKVAAAGTVVIAGAWA